jgi:dihydrofolate reductase
VTRSNLCIDGAFVYHSLEEALTAAHAIDTEEVHIGGGSEIYAQALPFVDRLYLTLVHDTKEADTFFPDYSMFTKETAREEREHNTLRYTWLTLERS